MISFPDEAFDRSQDLFINRLIRWMIDWKYRRSVNLKTWIKGLVDNPTDKVLAYASSSLIGSNHDETVMNVFKKVLGDLTYITDDKSTWKVEEYWQTPDETLSLRFGDCEDGTILVYVICRLLGVPANRFLIFAGDVNIGGHCWLGYKPSFNPIVYSFIDWSFYASKKSVKSRPKYYIVDKTIYPKSKYLKTWFGFNEDKAFTSFKLRF